MSNNGNLNMTENSRATDTLIGVDIGGTKCTVLAGKEDGTVVARHQFPTMDYDSTIRQILVNVESIVKRFESKAIGISCGGPLDSKRGVVLSPPNLPGWDEVLIVEMLEEATGLRVFLMNDANAGALAEWRWGAAKGVSDAVFLTCGTGMGSGLILGGKLHVGCCDLAGEVGHIRLAEEGPEGYGKQGSFEGFCSGGGIERLGRMRVLAALEGGISVPFCHHPKELHRLTVKTLAEAARNGDELAKRIFDESAHYLGRGLAILVDMLNPEVIVIGSVYVRCEDLLGTKAKETLCKEALSSAVGSCRIVPAALGETIGDKATLAVALNGLSQ